MKSTTIFIIALILLIGIGGFFLIRNGNLSGSTIQDLPDNQGNDEIQNVVLSYKNYNYFPNTITVKANQPVRISLDSSVGGCYRSFVMRDFGISKYLKTPSDYIEFTPTKKGTYKFSCAMGMGTGTLIVE